MNELDNRAVDLQKIFFPTFLDKLLAAKNKKFVYYTNAETALSIIKGKKIWMRNARFMNDYSEVKYGLKKILDVYNRSDEGKIFKNKLNENFHKITDEIDSALVVRIDELVNNTYIACMSRHLTKEDSVGRLSMWRAYGKNNGIALVINYESIFSNSGLPLPVFISSVEYFGTDEIKNQLKKITDNIVANTDEIKKMGRETIRDIVLQALVFGILCTKHPGFAEEREWRIIYCPKVLNAGTHLEKEILSINGIPQCIYKIPLEERYNTNLNVLLEQIIIGPTRYSSEIRKAFVSLLGDAGVDNPEGKVINSDIPLRC